ncbi:MAG TPA: S9 family peptidase, partial [Actinomycetota bacterium]|nr:S9 family peptidase [Actinomycetota bacterium]
MATVAGPDWRERFRAPTLTLPEWSRHAPHRAVLISDETGSFQAYAYDVASRARRKVTDERVGVMYATASADGREVVWFSDPTGDESGRWMAIPFDGGEPREVLPGAPVGWPDGLALGLHVVAGVLADREGFAVHVSRDGEPAKEILRHVDTIGIGGTDFHVEGFTVGGLS